MLKKSNNTQKNTKKTYHRPNVYRLGSLEQVKAGQGNKCDGPDCLIYYYG